MRRSLLVGTAGLVAALVVGTPGLAAAEPEPVLLGDLHPGGGSSMPPSNFGYFWSAGDRTFFGADDGVHGQEPFVSDGTPAGTVLIGDVRPGPAGSNPTYFTPSTHGTVFMTDDDREVGQIRVTTARGTGGDAGTTTLLAQGDDVVSVHGGSVGGLAVLTTSNFDSNAILWRSDGTVAGTFPIKQHLTLPDYVSPIGDVALFTDAQNPLMRTDGTAAGTRVVKKWRDGPNGSTVLLRVTTAGERVYFIVSAVNGIGSELWVSDGTKKGTRLVKDIRRGPRDSEVSRLTPAGRKLLFIADDGVRGNEIWQTNGTPGGTRRLTDTSARNIGKLAPCGRTLYFTATGRPGTGAQLFARSRGTVRRVADVPKSPKGLTCLGDTLVFSADDGSHGRELYTLSSPGAAPVLHDLAPYGSSRPSRFTLSNGALYFTANDGVHGLEPWVLAG